MGAIDTGRAPGSGHAQHRALCHALFDAIEQEDAEAMARCYAPGMTLWFNVTGREVSGEETIAAQEVGRRIQRRRTYDDRIISTFDDGFVVQYTLTIVLHDGTRRSLWACTVAEVHDGRIVKLSEYLDSSKFGGPRPRGRRPADASADADADAGTDADVVVAGTAPA